MILLSDVGVRLFIIILPIVNGLGLLLLAVIGIIIVVMKCKQRKYKGPKYERKHSTVI